MRTLQTYFHLRRFLTASTSLKMATKTRTDEEILNESWPSCEFRKIFLFGDSLTQRSFSKEGGWGTLLADHYQRYYMMQFEKYSCRRCDVLNRGFSGYNTRWCKEVLPCVFGSEEAVGVVAFTIFLGANDSADFELNPRQHVSVEEYKENLKEIVTGVLDQGIRRGSVILITPPAFDIDGRAEDCKKTGKIISRDNKVTSTYAKACREVAVEMGTPCVDLYTEMMKAEDFASYLCDGLHLSEKGSQLLFELLKPIIDKLTSHLPAAWFPFWDEVDVKDYKTHLQDCVSKQEEEAKSQEKNAEQGVL